MNVLLLAASDMSFLDGLLVFLIGNAVTVLALAFLVLVVLGYSGLLNKILDKKKTKPAEVKEEVSVPEIDDTAEQEELVAAISAAIAAVYASESDDGEVPPFRVKSIIAK